MPIHRLLIVAAALPFFVSLGALPVHAAAGPASADPNKPFACTEDPVADLIAQYAKGGDALMGAIARLVATQPCVADYVVAAANAASPDVAAALAAGLAQGAALLATTDPAAARQIRAAVSQSGDRGFATAFSVAYSVALAAGPAALASSDGSGLPSYNAQQGNMLVSPH
jgi:hypothetical protein